MKLFLIEKLFIDSNDKRNIANASYEYRSTA